MAYQKINFQNEPSTLTPVSAENLNHMDQGIYDANQGLVELQGLAYSPLVAATVADMTDEDRVYVYTGSETGYVAGDWYYYDGSAWVSGGVYNAVAVSTDKTLSISDKAADAKETGKVRNEFEQLSFKGVMNLQGDWVRGYSNISTGVIEPTNYRLTHANWLKFTQTVTLYVDDGYQYNAFDSNFNLLTATTTEPLTITAGTSFRVNIRKRPETPSVPADIAAFSSALKVSTIIDSIDGRLDECEDDIALTQIAHNSITTGTDLDNVTQIGIHPMTYSGTYAHDPVGTNHRRTLIVHKNADGNPFGQIMIDRDSGNIYTRSFSDSAWTAWKSKADTLENSITSIQSDMLISFKAHDSITNGTNLDSVTDMGFYPTGYGSVYVNDPVGKNHRRMLMVFKRASNLALFGQIIIDRDTGNIYTRSYADGAWNNWVSKFDAIETAKNYRPTNLDTHSHTVAHRGVPISTPAATKPSYVKVKEMGLLIAEGDVRFTSDNVAIIYHDATYTVDGVTHTIANETYEQFMEYDIGAAFSPEFAGTYGLSLSAFLDLCNELNLFPTLDFKVGTTQQINDCLDMIDAKRVKIFNYKASVANLKTIIDHDPYASVRLGADDYSVTLKNNLIDLIAYGSGTQTVHFIFAYGYGTWTSEQIAECKATGAIPGVSSINNNTQLQALTEDVDIIFTEHGFNATMYKTINAMAD